MGYRLHCYNCGYEENVSEDSIITCPRCSNTRIAFIKSLDCCRESFEYREGYNSGFRDGYNKALESYMEYMKNLEIARPIEVKVSPEEFERLKDRHKLNKEG